MKNFDIVFWYLNAVNDKSYSHLDKYLFSTILNNLIFIKIILRMFDVFWSLKWQWFLKTCNKHLCLSSIIIIIIIIYLTKKQTIQIQDNTKYNTNTNTIQIQIHYT